MTQLVRRERLGGGIDALVLDSERNRNALSLGLMDELVGGIRASADRGARALVLDHAGDVFCAGIDLHERRDPAVDRGAHSALLVRLLEELWAFPGPVLCRVGGAVRGGGMGLVAAADLVVAARTATFAFSEVKVGVAPAIVASLCLRKVPLGPLLPSLLTGETFDAEAARSLGLVAVVADDAAAALADRCGAVVQAAPGAAAATKRLARRAAGADDVGGLLREMETVSADLFASAEAAEGMAAFAERRPPAWVS